MQKLAVIILTKNEEKNITDVINNAKQCSDEIIIIDSGSTDNTVMLAEQAGAKVFFRAWDNDFAAQRNFGLTLTNAEWVLYLDADERLDNQLIAAINAVLKTDYTAKQYVVKRYSHAFGQQFRHGVLRPDHVARLFPRKDVLWEGKVHERPICTLKTGELAGHIEHYTYDNWQQYFQKFNQYTSLWAEGAFKRNKKTTMAGAFAHAVYAFIQMTIFKAGFLDGWLGLVLCCNHFSYTLTKYIKLKELLERRSSSSH